MKTLTELRDQITNLDEELLAILAKRFAVVREVGEYKKINNLPIRDKKREEELIMRFTEKGNAYGLSGGFITDFYTAIFKEAYHVEE